MRNRETRGAGGPDVPGRRQFLRCSLLAAAGAGSGFNALAARGGFQIGCWTRPWAKFDYLAALDGIAGAGYRYAGLMSLTVDGKPTGIHHDSAPGQIAEIDRQVRQRKLRVLSVWAGNFPYQKSMEEGVAGLKRIIDHCAQLGSPSLLLGGVGRPEQAVAYYKVVAECCPYAAEKKVVLSVKPHGGTNATGAHCRRLVEQIGHKNFGIFYDPGNIFYYSDAAIDPVDDAPSVDGVVVGVTVKDFRKPKEVMLTPGTGMVNFKEVMARLRKGGFTRGPLIVECLDPGDLEHINAEARKARLFVEGLVKG